MPNPDAFFPRFLTVFPPRGGRFSKTFEKYLFTTGGPAGILISMTCEHPLRYQPFSVGPWGCPVCVPPTRTPWAVGILQPDGTILSVEDMRACRRLRNQQGADARILAWAGPEWEVIHPLCGPDGWPVDSVAGVSFPPARPLLVCQKCLDPASARE